MFKGMLVAVAMFGIALFGFQDEEVKVEKVKIIQLNDNGDAFEITQENNGPFKVNINGEEMVLDAESMEIGESETFETEKGTITITRTEDGVNLVDEEGKTVSLQSDISDIHEIMSVNGATFAKVISGDLHKKIVINGLENLDESLMGKVREALKEAGIAEEIHIANNDAKIVWIEKDGGVQLDSDSEIHIGSDDKKIIRIEKDGGLELDTDGETRIHIIGSETFKVITKQGDENEQDANIVVLKKKVEKKKD